MALFRAFQIAQRVACQTIINPLLILALRVDAITNSNKETKEGGIIIDTPSHLKISNHTNIVHGQCKKKMKGGFNFTYTSQAFPRDIQR
jgi:hypothetical protein